MSLDVVDLRNFYAEQLGTLARRFIGLGIRSRWPDTRGQRVVGLGYTTPYLGLFRDEAERCLAFMPAAQGELPSRGIARPRTDGERSASDRVQRDASRVRGTLTQQQPPHPESALRLDSDLSPKALRGEVWVDAVTGRGQR